MKVVYSEQIPLRAITLRQLQEGACFPTDNLLKDIENARDKIVSLLRDYERVKDFGGHIYSFSIVANSLDMTHEGTGTIEIEFPIQIFNGCRDLNDSLADKMKLHVSVEFDNGTARITGEEAYTRDMDEI